MHLPINKASASHAAHKMHFLFHSLYLTAVALEGHLFYSLMAGGTLLFMIGTVILGDEH
jgi:hypothetical protein